MKYVSKTNGFYYDNEGNVFGLGLTKDVETETIPTIAGPGRKTVFLAPTQEVLKKLFEMGLDGIYESVEKTVKGVRQTNDTEE